MRIVKYWHFALEDRDEMFDKWGKYLEKSAKNPEKYPRYISGPSMIPETDCVKGVSIMEIDNEDQLINYVLALSPPLKAKYELLYDAMKYVQGYVEKKS